MRRIAFFEVAPYERAGIGAFSPADTEVLRFGEPLTPATAPKAEGAEAVSTFVYSTLDERVLDQLPGLRFITTRSTGYDHLDLKACVQRGVKASYVPSYGENTVAEHAFALVCALSRRLPWAITRTRALDFSLTGLEGTDLKGKVLGIVGLGRIGAHTARMGRGAGMQVLAYDPYQNPGLATSEGFRYVPFEELLGSSDVISIHAALVPQTFHLFDRRAFRAIKPGALLVNTARGAIIDSEALCEALDQGWIAGAGLDVFEGEELIKDERRVLDQPLSQQQLRQLAVCYSLLRRDNVVLTPHMAFFSRESVDRLLGTTFDNLRGYLSGRPQNLIPGAGS